MTRLLAFLGALVIAAIAVSTASIARPADGLRFKLSTSAQRDSVNLALDGVPRGIDLTEVRDYLAGLEGVAEVHDLHIWAMSTNETALTAHLVRPGGSDDAFLHGVCEELSHRFNIHHATLQIEAAGEICKLAPAERV